MSLSHADLSLPDGFNKTVRLFPLPNLVLFPGVIQALHLFEPRYRALMSDALANDELITMAFIKPDWKSEIVDQPDICSTVCVGKIITHTRLDDGCFNLLLLGAKRARIVQELSYDTPYRMAEIDLLDDVDHQTAEQASALIKKVIDAFRGLLTSRPQIDDESLEQLLGSDLSLGQLVDLIAYSSGASTVDQQRLLATTDIAKRAELLLDLLAVEIGESAIRNEASEQDFPPDFSLN